MPIYEFQCGWCGRTAEKYMSVDEWKTEKISCPNCGRKANKVFSACRQREFTARYIRDIQDKPVFVRNSAELRGEINRFNDSELAAKQGKISVYE